METKYIPTDRRLRSFRIFSAEFALVVFYVGNILFQTSPTQIIVFTLLLIIVLVALFFCAQYIYRGFFEQMTLSASGIHYHAFGRSIFIRWANLKRLGKTGRDNTEGVFASYQPEDTKAWLPGMPFGEDAFIPLSIFADNWRDSDLGQQIKQYAPHLYEQENKKSVQSA